jgi:peptide/nickel transport system substrate-binding protein
MEFCDNSPEVRGEIIMGRGQEMKKPLQNHLGRMMVALVSALLVALWSGPIGYGNVDAAEKPAKSVEGPRKGGTLKVALYADVPTLDVHTTTNSNTQYIVAHVYETLFILDKTGKTIPMLAERVVISKDRKQFDIKLREKVKFHDGKEMTSEDVVASLKRWGMKSPLGKATFDLVESVEGTGPYNVLIKTKKPHGTLISALAICAMGGSMIYEKAAIDAAGEKRIESPIGTGPFKFVERLPDRHVKLVRFDNYSARSETPDGYGGRRVPYVDEIFFIPVSDDATRVAGVEAGDFHFADNLPALEYERLSKNTSLKPIVTPPQGFNALIFNKKKGIMTDVRIRQAFLAAIDPEPIQQVMIGHKKFFELTPTLMQPGTIWESSAGKEFYNQKNPQRAKELLAKAGYKKEPIRWMTGRQSEYQSALLAKQQLEEAGFNIDVQFIEWATMFERREKPDLWDAFSTVLLARPDPSLLTPLPKTFPGWWEDQKKEDLLEQLKTEIDYAKRKQIWDALQLRVYEDVPFVNYGQIRRLRVARQNVEGYANMEDPFFWNVWLRN